MYNETLFYDLALSYTKGIGPVNTRKLLGYFESSKEVCTSANKDLLQIGQRFHGSACWVGLDIAPDVEIAA